MKRCTSCGEIKPLTEYHRLAKSADGRRTACKRCACEAARANARARSERPKQAPAPQKVCTVCDATKPATDFHRRRVAFDGLSGMCKPCAIAERAAYVAANPEKVRAYGESWRGNHPDYSASNARAWREQYPDRVREYAKAYAAAKPEFVAALKRAWYEANRDRLAEMNRSDPARIEARRIANRRSRERNRDKHTEQQRRRRAGGAVGEIDLDALWTGDCALCAEPMDREIRWPDPLSKSVDHIFPLVRGGLHEQTNLQWTHLFCNLSKGARLDVKGLAS